MPSLHANQLRDVRGKVLNENFGEANERTYMLLPTKKRKVFLIELDLLQCVSCVMVTTVTSWTYQLL